MKKFLAIAFLILIANIYLLNPFQSSESPYRKSSTSKERKQEDIISSHQPQEPSLEVSLEDSLVEKSETYSIPEPKETSSPSSKDELMEILSREASVPQVEPPIVEKQELQEESLVCDVPSSPERIPETKTIVQVQIPQAPQAPMKEQKSPLDLNVSSHQPDSLVENTPPSPQLTPKDELIAEVEEQPLLRNLPSQNKQARLALADEEIHLQKQRFQVDKSRQVLRVNLGQEPDSLHPLMGVNDPSQVLHRALFEGLTRIDPQGTLVLAGAEKVDTSVDHKTFIFHLRKNFWSNGDPVTAHDYIYAWKKALDPQHESYQNTKLFLIKNGEAAKQNLVDLKHIGLYAADDQTLVVTLEHSIPHFLELCSCPPFFPLPQKVEKANAYWFENSKTFVGNGPYALASWKKGEELLLARSENYWDASSVKLHKIHLFILPNLTRAFQMYQAGELDAFGGPFTPIPPSLLQQIQENRDLKHQSLARTYTYAVNTESAPWKHPKIRKALSYSLNRQAMIEALQLDQNQKALALMPPPLSLHELPQFTDHDTTRAQDLLNQALMELAMDRRDLPSLTLTFPRGEHHRNIAELMKKQWEETLVITVILEEVSPALYAQKIENQDYQCLQMHARSSIPRAEEFLERFEYPNAAYQATRWNSFRFSALLEKARNTEEEDPRTQYLKQAEQVLLHEMPVIPLFYESTAYLQDSDICDLFLSQTGIWDFKWAYRSAEIAWIPSCEQPDQPSGKKI